MRIVIASMITLVLTVLNASVTISCPRNCICSYYNGRHPMDCSSNGLTEMVSHIPEWTTSIRMDGNELSVLDLTFCDECDFFLELSFRYNDISKITYSTQRNNSRPVRRRSICSHISRIYSRLLTINVKGNAIRSLPKCFLFMFPKLQYLNLDENRIRSIHNLNVFVSFFHTHSLNELHLSQNLISQLIRKDMFTSTIGLRKLRVLNLSRNRIHTIESGVFTFFDDLQDLNLSGNKIGFLPDFCFSAKGQTLQKIDLRNNKIDWISSRTFAGLPDLQILDLRQNMIECIYPAKWSTCQYLSLCSLGATDSSPKSDRELKHFSRRFTVTFNSNLRVKAAGNPLLCDCRLVRLLDSCGTQCDNDELTCSAPVPYRGKSLSRVVGHLQCV